MEITLNDVMPYIVAWSCLALGLLSALCYRVWKLSRNSPKVETPEKFEEREILYSNYAVLLFSGILVYGAVFCVLVYIGAPFKQPRELFSLLLFFSISFIILMRKFQKIKYKSV